MNQKILIVDDNSINRKYATSVLTKAGISVFDVSSGEEALEILKSKNFELILLDIQMPNMDGFETLTKIKSDFPKVTCPVLAITAFYGDYGKATFMDAGFQNVIRKPIKPNELIDVVKTWLHKSVHPEIKKSKGATDIIDLTVYNEIKKYAENADINDLYTEFENETSSFFKKLKFLIPAKNYPEILSTLHTIKGNSGSLGISAMAAISEQLEADIRLSKKLDLVKRFSQLEESFLIFKNKYRQFLNIK